MICLSFFWKIIYFLFHITEKYSPRKVYGLHLYTQMFSQLTTKLKNSKEYSNAISGKTSIKPICNIILTDKVIYFCQYNMTDTPIKHIYAVKQWSE